MYASTFSEQYYGFDWPWDTVSLGNKNSHTVWWKLCENSLKHPQSTQSCEPHFHVVSKVSCLPHEIKKTPKKQNQIAPSNTTAQRISSPQVHWQLWELFNPPVSLTPSSAQPAANRSQRKEECPCTGHWGCHCASGGTAAGSDASGFAWKTGR